MTIIFYNCFYHITPLENGCFTIGIYHVFTTAEKSRQIFLQCRKLCQQRRKVDECAKVKAQSQHAETLEAGDQWMHFSGISWDLYNRISWDFGSFRMLSGAFFPGVDRIFFASCSRNLSRKETSIFREESQDEP